MASDGWVKLFRKITEWEWYQDSQMVHLFIHLVVMANHQDKKWKGVEVKRGQLLTGRKALSESTGISEKAVRNRLNRLEEGGEIIKKTASKFSIITICKYEDYQQEENQKGQQRASKGPAKGHKQECKERKEKDSCANAPKKEAHCTLRNGEAFSSFWEIYPKKRDKLKARTAWDKIKPDTKLTQQILSAVSLQKKTKDWTKEDGRYIPMPTTWLNGRRWEDEIETTEADEWQ